MKLFFLRATGFVCTILMSLIATAQEQELGSIFVTNGPNYSRLSEQVQQWQTEPDFFSKASGSPIKKLETKPGKEIVEIGDFVLEFMDSNLVDRARLKASNNFSIDVYRNKNNDLLMAPVSSSSEFVFDKERDGLEFLEIDITILNTGDPDIPSESIRVALQDVVRLRDLGLPAETAEHERMSWSTVAIYHRYSATAPICTGVLVSPSLVLTAAHCLCPDTSIRNPSTLKIQAKVQPLSNTNSDHPNVLVDAEKYFEFFTQSHSYCRYHGNAESREDYGDVVLIKLKEKIQTALENSGSPILQSISKYVVSSVISENQDIWKPNTCTFRTLGFGKGPDQSDASLQDISEDNLSLRRDLSYQVSKSVIKEGKAGVIISEFGDPNNAVCQSDSGSGVFVPTVSECTHAGENTNMTLAGIVSKIGQPGPCFIGDGLNVVPTPVVRLDTPEIRKWMSDVSSQFGETIIFNKAAGSSVLLSDAQ